jgi:hypothetical protein
MDHLRLKLLHPARLCLGTLGFFIALNATAAPLLRCQVAYAGTTHTVEARPVADPYTVPSTDIGGRFLFKPVMVGNARRIDYIKLYAYLDASRQPVLIQQATYLPPFKRFAKPYVLTGVQHLYGGPVERELIYSCTLEGVA